MQARTTHQLQSAAQLGLYLRSLRRLRRMTQPQVGERMGVTAMRISKIERDPGSVSFGQILKLLNVLGARAVLEVKAIDEGMQSEKSAPRGEW